MTDYLEYYNHVGNFQLHKSGAKISEIYKQNVVLLQESLTLIVAANRILHTSSKG